jgi:hypothetical protein
MAPRRAFLRRSLLRRPLGGAPPSRSDRSFAAFAVFAVFAVAVGCGKSNGGATDKGSSAAASSSANPNAKVRVKWLPHLLPKLYSLEVEACFADLACPLTKQRARLKEADDKGGTDLVCDRFLFGLGVERDLQRARGCWERKVSVYGQTSSVSCDRERIVLALLEYEGLGGPRDAPLGRGILARCAPDESVQNAFRLGEESLTSKREAPIDFCTEVAATPLHRNQCQTVAALRARTKATDTQKSLSPDEKQQKLLTTLGAYWREIGELDDQRAVLGVTEPARSEQLAAQDTRSMRRYAALMDVLSTYTPRDPAIVEKLEPLVRRRMKMLAETAAAESPDEKGSYRALRDQAVEVFVAFHGAKFAKDKITRDVRDRLDEERAREVFGKEDGLPSSGATPAGGN